MVVGGSLLELGGASRDAELRATIALLQRYCAGVPIRTAARTPTAGVEHPSTAARGDAGALASAAPEPATQSAAAELLGAMAAVRRTTRRVGHRPTLLSELTGSQLELVRLVGRRPGLSVAEAAEELRLAPNTVSTLVRQLTAAGVVVRVPDTHDRRVARLDLGEETRRKVADWRDRRAEAVADAMLGLGDGERRTLGEAVAVLARLADLLDARAVSPGAGRGEGSTPRGADAP